MMISQVDAIGEAAWLPRLLLLTKRLPLFIAAMSSTTVFSCGTHVR